MSWLGSGQALRFRPGPPRRAAQRSERRSVTGHVQSSALGASILRSGHSPDFSKIRLEARLLAQWIDEWIGFLGTPKPESRIWAGRGEPSFTLPTLVAPVVRYRRASPSFTSLQPRSPTLGPVSCTDLLGRLAFLRCLKSQRREPQGPDVGRPNDHGHRANPIALHRQSRRRP
jgi:hypothetical protein